MPIPDTAPLRDRLCVLRCRLTYAQQRIRELEALLAACGIPVPAPVIVVPPADHDCFSRRPEGQKP